MKITKQPRHLIILMALLCLLGWSKGALADVYWNPNIEQGTTPQDGTAAHPYRDWSSAKEALAGQPDGQWIILMATGQIHSGIGGGSWTMNGEISETRNAQVKRNAGFKAQMFNVQEGITFTMKNVTISGECIGGTPHPGTRSIVEMAAGATFVIDEGTVLMNNYNTITYGGAVFSDKNATVTMKEGSKITGCQGIYGGAIALNFYESNVSTFTMEGGIIEDCEATYSTTSHGGGIWIQGKNASYKSKLILKGGVIRRCKSNGTNGNSGGFYANITDVELKADALTGTVPEISANECTTNGGAAYIDNSSVTMSAGVVMGNTAGASSGGLAIVKTTMTMSGGTISGNSAPIGGGIAITNGATTVTISGGTISNNTATTQAGGINMNALSVLNITSSAVLIEGNKAPLGGGLYIGSGGGSATANITSGVFRNNIATDKGGGIYLENDGKLNMSGTSLSVKGNTVNGAPNNVYLPSGQTIKVTADFNPVYLGVYNEATGTTIPVFTGTSDLTPINTGINGGTYNIYDDKQLHQQSSLTNSNTILNFIGTPWTYRQRQITTDDYKYEISNVEELTAFLCHVNGITPNATSFGSGDPTANGKLVADIDMSGQYWEPISASYTGTFDGNGHTISNLSMVPTNAGTGRGLFGTNSSGTIKNVILKDCYFGASSGNVGTIVSQNNSGGTISNCVAEGDLAATGTGVVMGGVAGANSGTVHSCYAMPDMTGYAMGGLVGSNSGSVLNSFVNAKFTSKTGNTAYMGGLVAVNTGTVENCYSRVQGSAPASNFGWLVGNNTGGTVNYGYIPDGQSIYKAAGNDPSGHGTYSATLLPVRYNHTNDNQVTFVSGGDTKQLLATLNNWVNQDASHKSTYTPWLRPWQKDNDSKFINDDLPLLRLPATNAVAATSGDPYLDYNQVNELLTAYNTANDAVLFYGAESNMNGNVGSEASLYIDEEATLKQSGSKGAITARTSQMLKTYTAERWHHFSSPLKESQIGFTYNNTDPVPFNWNSNPCSVTINSNDDYSLFPSDLLTATSFASVDLFCFYEPEYHWLNLKRATNSHWHMNDTDLPISYEGNGIQPDPANPGGDPSIGNETYLVPGKGYLVSVDVDQLVQNYGTLNDGGVTLYSVTKSDYNAWAERLGFNLLGNPYQSYLDFEEFKAVNGSNLWASSADIYEYTYAVFDPELNAYRQYKDGSSVFSNAASQYIHPHQGFFIRMTKGTDPANRTTVTYTDDMRVVTLPGDATSPFRGEAQPTFPLINLVVNDSEGNADLAVLELDRTNDEGAEKIRLSECKGLLSLGYEGRDYGILFRSKIEDYQPLRFEALEAGTFTLEWNTANGQFSELTLIDNIAGTTTDMLSRDSYSFEGNPDQYASRFKIVIGDYKDIEDHEEDGPSTGSGTFAFVMGDELVVNGEGTLSLYDVTGRLLMQTSLHGSQTNIALPEVSAGVYVLQLVSDHNGKKTQKIILE